MSVSYCLLQAHVERIKNCQTLAYEDQSRPNHLDVLVAKNTSETQEQQVQYELQTPQRIIANALT